MRHAAMAQEVERILGKDEVTSSTLVSSSRKAPCSKEQGAFLSKPTGLVYHQMRQVAFVSHHTIGVYQKMSA